MPEHSAVVILFVRIFISLIKIKLSIKCTENLCNIPMTFEKGISDAVAYFVFN